MKINALMAAGALAALLAAPISAHAAQGLNGAYYTVGSWPETAANAAALIAGMTPTATFTANTVCFPSCSAALGDGGATLNDFFGGNASNISPNSVTDLTAHVVVLTGYYNAPTTGSYSFSLGSDDGSQLYIDGILVANNDGDHGFGYVSGSANLIAGLNAIRIIQFEDGGSTGLSVLDANGAGLGGSELSTTGGVPEPANWALMLIGVGGLGAVLRAQRRTNRELEALRG